MNRVRRLPLLVALLLLAQWGSAFALCMRHAQAIAARTAWPVVLCTPGGLVSVALPGDPDTAPPDSPELAACPFCQGPGPALLPAPASAGLRALAPPQRLDPPAMDGVASPLSRALPPPPRAPPAS